MINQFKSAAQIASSSLIFDMIGMISLYLLSFWQVLICRLFSNVCEMPRVV